MPNPSDRDKVLSQYVLWAERDYSFRGYSIYLALRNISERQVSLAKPVVFSEPIDHRQAVAKVPFLELTRIEIQELFDCFWKLGFRPDAESSSIGQTDAIISHLKDMRALVEHTLKVKLPEVATK